MDPRRPPLRRHAQGAPRPPLRRRAAHPHHRRPRDAGPGRGGGRGDPPRPQRARRLARRRSRRPPATCGRWSAAATSSARARSPSSTWPPRAPARPARRSSRSSSPPPSTQGIDPLDAHLGARPASRSRCENAEPWRPCNYGGGGGGTRHHRRGHGALLQHPLRAAHACGSGPKAAMEVATRYGHPEPARARARPAVLGSNDVTAMDMAARLLHLRQPRHPGAARAGHPDHPGRRHRAVQPASTSQTKVLEAGIVDTRHQHPRAGDRAGHRHPGQARPPGGRQDRHHRRQQRRLVRGYTPQLATAVWVGLPELGADEQADPDAPAATRRSRSPAARTRRRSGSGS